MRTGICALGLGAANRPRIRNRTRRVQAKEMRKNGFPLALPNLSLAGAERKHRMHQVAKHSFGLSALPLVYLSWQPSGSVTLCPGVIGEHHDKRNRWLPPDWPTMRIHAAQLLPTHGWRCRSWAGARQKPHPSETGA